MRHSKHENCNYSAMGRSISHHVKSLENTIVDVNTAKVLELLRYQNIDLKTISDSRHALLYLILKSIRSSQNQIIEILNILFNTDLNSEEGSKMALVHYAVEQRNIKAIEWLKDNGADLSGIAKNGKNSLFWLCYEPSWEKIDNDKQEILFDLLVDGGCDVNAGRTPLHLASETNNIVVVKKLLAHGAEVNCRDNQNGKPPLHLAVSQGHLEIIKCLLDKGANVNSKDSSGDRPLHVAAISKNAGIVLEMLLRRNVLVNARNNEGNTALVTAYRHGNIDCMRELLKNGADINDKYLVETLINRYDSCEAQFLLKNCIKLKAADLPYPKEYFVFTRGEEHQMLYEDCLREIEILKNTFIDSSTSLYAWLHMDRNRRCIHSHNQNLITLVYSPTLEEQFPQYSIVIVSTYRSTVTRRALLQPAKNVWAKLTEIYLPDTCLECIFTYLDDADLIDFVEMVNYDT